MNIPDDSLIEDVRQKVKDHLKTNCTQAGTPLLTTCNKCHCVIKFLTVPYTILDGVFASSGSGRVENVAVPYCPNCEGEPKN